MWEGSQVTYQIEASEEEEVSSNSVPGSAGSKRPLVITLAVIGVICLVLGILWFAGAAPGFLDAGSHVKGSGGHNYRGGAAVVVGVVALVGAYVMNKKSSSS